MFFKPDAQGLVDQAFDDRADFEDTSLSLVCEENLGSGTFTESTAVSPSRQSSPVSDTFSFLVIPDVSA